MKYTHEYVKSQLRRAMEMLKENPNCNVSDEELLSRYTKLASEENLDILSLLMCAVEGNK